MSFPLHLNYLESESDSISRLAVSNSLWLHVLYPTRSSVSGILQARMLEWVGNSFSGWSSWRRDQTQAFHIAGRFFILWSTREGHRGSPTVEQIFFISLVSIISFVFNEISIKICN